MDQKLFIQKTDEMLSSMNEAELRSCLHNIARKTPEDKRESFLQLLEDGIGQDDQKDDGEKPVFKRLMTDERVKDELSEIEEDFWGIEEGDLCLSAHGYEDYSEGYWRSDWNWTYEDNDDIGYIFEDAFRFAHDCMMDCRYIEARKVFDMIIETKITVVDEESGERYDISLEEMVNEDLAGVDLRTLALDVLYTAYQLADPEKRASVLYTFYEHDYFQDIHIEEIVSIGREELTDFDAFLESWIVLLMKTSGEMESRLLIDALLYHKGTDGLLEMAKIGYNEHPSLYMAVLSEYEKKHDYESIKTIGQEALDKLDHNLRIRGEIAVKVSQASCKIHDYEWMRHCWYDAFYSDSTVPNFLMIFLDPRTIKEFKSAAEERIAQLVISNHHESVSEKAKNTVSDMEYKFLCFFSGQFERIQTWCKEQKDPLGWTGEFIIHGINLMLMYLYSNVNLKKAMKQIAIDISKQIGFDKSNNFIFMIENNVFQMQSNEEIFYSVFHLWKKNYPVSEEEASSYVKWLESVINRRVTAILGGQYRNKYDQIALWIAALGEVKESLGDPMAKMTMITKYMDQFSRYTAFRKELRKYSN